MTPGRKFSMSTSARAAIRRSRAAPSGSLRLRVTPSLLELSIANGAPAPATLPRERRLSPQRGSTLMIRAPASRQEEGGVGGVVDLSQVDDGDAVEGRDRIVRIAHVTGP